MGLPVWEGVREKLGGGLKIGGGGVGGVSDGRRKERVWVCFFFQRVGRVGGRREGGRGHTSHQSLLAVSC